MAPNALNRGEVGLNIYEVMILNNSIKLLIIRIINVFLSHLFGRMRPLQGIVQIFCFIKDLLNII